MLGISIYPDKATLEEIKDYIDTAHKYGFKRIFTCLLSVNKPKEEIAEDFKSFINYATNLGMEVILDISPAVFSKLEINYDDLSFFAELGATGIRLDESYNGAVEAKMTYNPFGLDIEINMSQDTNYLNTILDYQPNLEKLIGCHNFYPQRYCGLNFEYFVQCSKRFKDLGIRSAAFINSPTATTGPWPVMEGMVTAEIHRDLAITTQVKHLYALDIIDDIIIANQFATEAELKAISEIEKNKITLKVTTSSENSGVENTIIFDEHHFNRGDINDYLVRSTQSRVKFRAEAFPPHDNPQAISKGDIIIGNDNFGQYKGELQLVKNDLIDDEQKRNVVARVVDEELFLIDLIKPWQVIKFEQ
ncbi:MAG: DUF871 domain-containing protein [Mycoplasmatales bacterium]